MKKSTKKLFTLAMTLTLVVSAAMLFTSCGATTLEDYVNSNEETKQALEESNSQNSAGNMTVEVKENTVYYNFKLDETVDKDVAEAMNTYFESYMKSVGSTFEGIAAGLEEESKVEGVKVKVTFLNGDDSELYSQEFEAAKAKDKTDEKADDAE